MLRVQRQPIGAVARIEARGHLAATKTALERVERERLAVAPDRAAERTQLDAAGQDAAQRLERDPAAPATDEPRAQRLAGVTSGRADGQRERGHKIERVEPDFAIDALLLIERHGEMAAQMRAGGSAVEIVEGQAVAGQRRRARTG